MSVCRGDLGLFLGVLLFFVVVVVVVCFVFVVLLFVCFYFDTDFRHIPTFNVFTSEPTTVTTPLASWPVMIGLVIAAPWLPPFCQHAMSDPQIDTCSIRN